MATIQPTYDDILLRSQELDRQFQETDRKILEIRNDGQFTPAV